MPKRIKRKRPITSEQGGQLGMEEYYDYVFPEEAGAAPNLKLLEAAMRWKRQKMMAQTAGGNANGRDNAADAEPEQQQHQDEEEEQQQVDEEQPQEQQPADEADEDEFVV